MNALADIETAGDAEAWDRIQSVAMSLARVRRHPYLEPLAAEAFGAWVALQRKDLDAGTREIDTLLSSSDAAPSDPARTATTKTTSDLAVRTTQIERTHALARDICRKLEDGLVHLKKAGQRRASGDLRGLSDLAITVDTLASEIDSMMSDLAPHLDPEKIERSLRSAEAGERPIQQVLQSRISALKSTPSVAKPPETVKQAAQMPRPSPVPQDPSEPAPINAQMRKRLGRALSAMEIEHVSYQFFTMLWENDVAPERVGDILFHTPANCGGMTVHDLLGYSNGPEMLRLSLKDFQVRFPGDRR